MQLVFLKLASHGCTTTALRGGVNHLRARRAPAGFSHQRSTASSSVNLAWCGLGFAAGLARRTTRRARRFFNSRRVTTASVAVDSATPSIITASARDGDKLHGWTCLRAEPLTELNCMGLLWRHDATGAELLSVEQPAEENKTFGVTFRTPPADSTGVAHVLEHAVLCGSRKYPIKEPFVELLKGSVQTFLNAMTFPDRTSYPVASCNLQDFYNLIDVYLDAVLHPRALSDPRVLAQEGWHYEPDGGALRFKGVVFNEMKGVYSDPDAVMQRALLTQLLPDTPYAFDYGGDPADIPNLTFDGFRDFHRRFYHPSNAKFWFYGDDPPAKRLELLNVFLQEFKSSPVRSDVPRQPLWTVPRQSTHLFAVGPDEDISKKAMASVSWVLGSEKPDLETALALGVLNYTLMGTPASPLRKALTDASLGSRVIGGGLYDGLVQPTFSVGLKDISEKDAAKVEDMVLDTLQKIANEGLETEAVEAALNKIEFLNRELNTGGFPRGLALMFSAVSNWNYDLDPFEALRFDKPLRDLRIKLIDGQEKMLEDLIRRMFLENPHRLTLTSEPSHEEGPRLEFQEAERLRAHQRQLSVEELEQLATETEELKVLQEAPDSQEALAQIPRLQLSDIPAEAPGVATDLHEIQGCQVLKHPLLCSGIVYVDVAFPLDAVPSKLLPLLPLFCTSLRQMGTQRSDFVALQRRIDLSTGGVNASPMISSKRNLEPCAYLILRGKAMQGQSGQLMDLLAELVTETAWGNQDRFRQLVKEALAGARSRLLSAGHSVAAGRLARQTTVAGWASEQLTGLSQFDALGNLLNRVDNDWPSVEAELRELQSIVLQRRCTLNLTADALALPGFDSVAANFLKRLPEASSIASAWQPLLQPCNEAIIVPSQVNYVAKGSNLYTGSAAYKFHSSAIVTSRLLGTTWLWDKVRVVGGAYGAFCSFDHRSGDFKYVSYRDPNLADTLTAYDGTGDFLRTMDVTADELAKGIIGTMGEIDSYQLPDAKGYTELQRYLWGEGYEFRQQLRDEVLSTSAKNIRDFAEAVDAVRHEGAVCVVGGDAAINEAAAKAGSPLYGIAARSPFAAP